MILFITFFLFEVYSIGLLIYLIILLVKKKQLPWLILISELFCLLLFFYLRYLIGEHRLIFVGHYVDGTEDWGAGLANVSTVFINIGILVLILLVTQILFWFYFNKIYKKINPSELDKDPWNTLLK